MVVQGWTNMDRRQGERVRLSATILEVEDSIPDEEIKGLEDGKVSVYSYLSWPILFSLISHLI